MPGKKRSKAAVAIDASQHSEERSSDNSETWLLHNKLEMVDLDSLEEHPDNPRIGDVAAIENSIRANGFYGALVVQRSTRRILVGNHRARAARKLGIQKVPVLWADVDDKHALRILLADNRSNDLATYDYDRLTELLESVASSIEDTIGTCYSPEAVEAIIQSRAASTTQLDEAANPFRALAEIMHGTTKLDLVPLRIGELEGGIVRAAAESFANALAESGNIPVGRFFAKLLQKPLEELGHPYTLPGDEEADVES